MKKIFSRPKLLLWLAIFLYLAVFFSLSLYKYQNFLYNLEDLSIFNNVLYNTAHGNLFWFSSHGGFSYLGDHLELGLLLLLPIYFFFQTPLTLLFIQTALFALSAWPLYLICQGAMNCGPDQILNHQAKLKKTLPLLISLIFLLNPFLHNINLEEFHLAPLLIFFFLWTFYFYLQKRYRLFILFFILTLLFREDAALTLGALALLIAWDKGSGRDETALPRSSLFKNLWSEKKWWLYPLLISLIWFFVSLKIINFFNPDSGYRFLILYQRLDIYQPLTWLPKLFNFKTLSLATGYLLPFLFLPLYRPKYLFLALPSFLQASLLDAGASSISYYTHHQIFILTALFLSLSGALTSIVRREKHQKYLFLIIGLLVFSQFYLSAFLGPLKFISQSSEKNLIKLENKRQNLEILSLIPPQASLSGPYRFMPRLSSRQKAYFNKLTFLGKKHLAVGDFSLPDDTQYWLIDSADVIEYYLHFQNRDRYSPLYWNGAERMRQTMARQNFRLLALTDSLILFKKDEKDAAASLRPYQITDQLPTDLQGQKADWGEMDFLGFKGERSEIIEQAPQNKDYLSSPRQDKGNEFHPEKILSLNLYLQPKQKITDDYFFEITILDINLKPIRQKIYPPAYGLLPTHDWPIDKYIRITQVLPADPKTASYQINLLKIKGDIELGPLNDTQLVVDKKEKVGEPILIKF